jgi:hypothetical protein
MRDTGPSASAHVMVKGSPAVMVEKTWLVRITLECASAKATDATRRLENCILMDGIKKVVLVKKLVERV